MEFDDQVPLVVTNLTWQLVVNDLLPGHKLLEAGLVKDHYFLNFGFLQGGYLQVKFLDFLREWAQADRLEIKRFTSHVFKYSVKGEIIVFPEGQFEE